jgi:hypothetical protein
MIKVIHDQNMGARYVSVSSSVHIAGPEGLRSSESGWFRKHNWGAYRQGAQFGCGVVRHTTGPYKPFISEFI